MIIKRSIFNKLADQIHHPKVSILIGPRQVGKTFLLKELEVRAKELGLKTRYFDLEQPEDLLSLGATEKEQFEVLTSSGECIFVDELHFLKNISHLFKAVYDGKRKVKIFASGSSALSMHRHLKESMAGRLIMNRIFPLSLTELSQIHSFEPESVLRYGALPGLIHCADEEEKIQELQTMVATYISKDIKSLVKEENIRAFNHLIALLAENQGSVTVVANLANEIGLSKPAIERYLEILSQTYVCYPVLSFSRNAGNELKKSKKFYLYDIGIRNSLVKNFARLETRADSGVLKESFVLNSIVRQLKANMEVRFWRTKQGDEIDFILLKNRVPFPVEVKSALGRVEIPKSLKVFLDRYAEAPGAIVYNDHLEETVRYGSRSIQFQRWPSADLIPFLQSVS